MHVSDAIAKKGPKQVRRRSKKRPRKRLEKHIFDDSFGEATVFAADNFSAFWPQQSALWRQFRRLDGFCKGPVFAELARLTTVSHFSTRGLSSSTTVSEIGLFVDHRAIHFPTRRPSFFDDSFADWTVFGSQDNASCGCRARTFDDSFGDCSVFDERTVFFDDSFGDWTAFCSQDFPFFDERTFTFRRQFRRLDGFRITGKWEPKKVDDFPFRPPTKTSEKNGCEQYENPKKFIQQKQTHYMWQDTLR